MAAAGLEDRTILMYQTWQQFEVDASLSKLNWVVQKIVNSSYFHYVIKHMSTLASLKTDRLYIILIVTAATEKSLT